MSRITDQAWNQIRVSAGTVRGTRGHRFHMANATIGLLIRERGLKVAPVLLYGVPIIQDEEIPYGTILLKPRTDYRWETAEREKR